jgi:3-hydroxyisobutyrate dehydrogenase-like beta-hydroxyacid dehydrogenase
LERIAPYLRSGDASSLRFAMSNAQKDLSYYKTMADEAGAADVIAGAVLETFEQGVRTGGPHALVLELVAQLSSG